MDLGVILDHIHCHQSDNPTIYIQAKFPMWQDLAVGRSKDKGINSLTSFARIKIDLFMGTRNL